MNPENCVVIGPAPVQYDLQTLVNFSDTVVAGNTHKNNSFTYATVASETRLQDMLNTPSFRDTIILAPDKLYKKYVFFEQIDNLPSLPFVKSTGKSTENLSDQSLALMLALWLTTEVNRYCPTQANSIQTWSPTRLSLASKT